eukprot:CAMPEP_0196142696 /NCGR_PEP_ID=MMETSP0910-20130528/12115_1 /TAXON_ID=49265 /ORGANISM="Thalassiosira rotula, Strain GSO102" /LENGTH=151 /DNA_ID=CAMNT_0041404047 /DNA_START=249 /DNA_END=701 /DNA_ORIENTATION=-
MKPLSPFRNTSTTMGEPKPLLRQRRQPQQRRLRQRANVEEEEVESPQSSSSSQQQRRRRTLEAALNAIHENEAVEFDANDAEGEQGGQLWKKPTGSPTPAPTTAEPTRAPTSHPTLHGQEYILRGVMWYDRNGNGVRDPNVKAKGLGHDVE